MAKRTANRLQADFGFDAAQTDHEKRTIRFKLAEYTEEVRDHVCRVIRTYGPKAFADLLGMTQQLLENMTNGRDRHYIRLEVILLALLLDTTDGLARALMAHVGRGCEPLVKLTPQQVNEKLEAALRSFGSKGEEAKREQGL